MKGICSVCNKKVPVITIKDGGLFEPDKPYEICVEHKIPFLFFWKKICLGTDKTPIKLFNE